MARLDGGGGGTPDRAAVVELLRSRIGLATADRVGTSLCVRGPAGIGKSSLIRSLLDDVTHPASPPTPTAVTTLRAVGDERRRHEPFAVLGQLTGPVPSGDDPADTVLDRVDELCAAGPVVVWVDDAHHADAASLAGLRRMVWAGRSLPLTVVLSTRPTPWPEQLELLVRQVETSVELPPMDPMMAEGLVRDRLGRWPGPRLRRVLDGAGGNPLFLTELIRELQRGDRLQPAGRDAVDIAPGVSMRGTALDSLIRTHLAGVDETGTELLTALAVWGTAARLGDLADLLYSTPQALAPAVDQTVRAGVALVLSDIDAVDGRLDGTVDFVHDLYREVAYEAAAEADRRRLHRRVAAVLTGRGADPALIAEHLLQATSDRDRDADGKDLLAALNAAVAASGTFAPQVAVDLLALADGLTTRDDPAAERVLLQRADELFRTGRGAAAERLVRERIGEVRDPAVAAGLQRVLITSQINRADVDGALDSMGRTLSIEQLPPPVRRSLEAQRQWLLLLGGRFDRLADLDALRAQALAADDQAAAATLVMTASVLAYVQGDANRALALATTSPGPAPAGELGPGTSNVWPALFRLDVQGPAAAVQEVERARAAVARTQRPWVAPFLGFVAAGAAWAAGDWDGAVAESDAALEVAEETGTGWTSIAVGVRIDLDARRGHLRAARRRLAEFRARRLPDQFGRGDMDVAEMSILEAEGAIEHAAALGEAYWTRARTRPGFGGAEFAIDIVRLGLIAHRPSLVEQVVEDVRRLDPRHRPPGVLEFIRGAVRSDLADLERADRAFRDRGRINRVLHTQEELACAAAAGGDRARAVAAMEEALAGYERVRATVDRDRLLARLRRLGVRRGSRQAHRTRADGWAALTATERRITDLICEGLTNREIAARLFVSPRTVQSHVSHILDKTGLRSRVEVAAAATAQTG